MKQIFRFLVTLTVIMVLGLGISNASAQEVGCPVTDGTTSSTAEEGTLNTALSMICRDGEWLSVVQAQQQSLNETIVESDNNLLWHMAPLENGQTHPATDIGSLDTALPTMCEVWGPTVEEGVVFTFPASSMVWLQGYYGGTCWAIEPNELDDEVAHSVSAMTAEHGNAPLVARLPLDSFVLLGCLQSQPVEDHVRTCDAVGDEEAFVLALGAPFPGYIVNTGVAPQITNSQQTQTVSTDCSIWVENQVSNMNIRSAPSTSAIVNRAEKSYSADVVGSILGDDGYTWWQTEDGWIRHDVVNVEGNCPEVVSPTDSANSASSLSVTDALDYSQLGLSGSFTCVGPAILETDSEGPLAVRVDLGASVPYSTGNCWTFSAQSQLEVRFPNHVSEFRQKYPNAAAFPELAG